MRTIPQIRVRLHELDELHDLAEETKRRPPAHMTRSKHKNPDPSLEQRIRAYARQNPEKSYKDIANDLDTGIRCVSYAIAGRRGDSHDTRRKSQGSSEQGYSYAR